MIEPNVGKGCKLRSKNIPYLGIFNKIFNLTTRVVTYFADDHILVLQIPWRAECQFQCNICFNYNNLYLSDKNWFQLWIIKPYKKYVHHIKKCTASEMLQIIDLSLTAKIVYLPHTRESHRQHSVDYLKRIVEHYNSLKEF